MSTPPRSGASGPATKQSLYRPELDVLRFLAFIAVFIFQIITYPVNYYMQRGIPLFLAEALSATLAASMACRGFSILGKSLTGFTLHMFCIMTAERLLAIRHRIPEHTFLHLALNDSLSLGLTIAVSALSYRVLEKPFLKLKQRFTRVCSRPA